MTDDGHDRPRAWLAGLLSFSLPGLGQLYTGRPRRALLFFLGDLSILLAVAVSPILTVLSGLVIVLALKLLVPLLSLIDAVRSARKGAARSWHRPWYLWVGAWVLLAFAIAPVLQGLILPRLGLRTFYIPSGAMAPTLQPGDRILTEARTMRDLPARRGELVVHRSPEDPEVLLVKRVIGLAGDVVEIRDKQVFLNGEAVQEPWSHHIDSTTYAASRFLAPSLRLRDNFGPFEVPQSHLFLLGDNRDYSYDSRFHGPVPEDYLVSRALYVYWSDDKDRIGFRLDS